MPVLPTGTVTLLFTDMEGSTRLLERLGDRYVELLYEHRRLLRAAVAQFNGREVDMEGDATFVAFTSARAAVAAAVAGQHALAAHAWPDGAKPRQPGRKVASSHVPPTCRHSSYVHTASWVGS